jgi:sensor domain CHASE-containing protein
VTLGWKLFIVFLGFLAVLTTVIVVAFRERKHGRTIDDNDIAAQQAQDGRVMTIIFSAIVGGMALTLITAYLVFF